MVRTWDYSNLLATFKVFTLPSDHVSPWVSIWFVDLVGKQ
jgi:hypothetical protein